MEQIFADKIMPSRWFWCIVNNLHKFNDRPEFIETLVYKFKRIEDHRALSMLGRVAEKLTEAYEALGSFPDPAWLKLNFKDNITIQVNNDQFSMQIYESLCKYLDQEFLKQELDKKVVSMENPSVEDIRFLTRELTNFTDKAMNIPENTKDTIKGLYKEYSADFKGIKTNIKPIDDIIGVLGYKSLSVFAAPSGHGKSTFAFSVAYYAALSGFVVDYLTFEVPFNHAWFNLASMHSLNNPDKSKRLKSSDLKEALLSKEETDIYEETVGDLLHQIGEAGGFLNILDQEKLSIDTYESLCAKLESIAEQRGRKADLIVVDNVDNLQILKSTERDEATRVNNYIISLDGFSKKYHNGDGVAILLLSQVNRTGLKKLQAMNHEDGERRGSVDVTCIQRFNALYEKPTCALVGFSNEVLRASDTMHIFPVKLRNRGIPEKPIVVRVDFAHSRVIGNFALSKVTEGKKTEKEKKDAMTEHLNQWIEARAQGVSAEEEFEVDDLTKGI